MIKRTTSPLVLDAMLVTGNTKAAIKAAGGGSSDLWTVPPASLHYDPRDNIRPLDPAHVRRVADLIKANGYDRKKPIGCIVKKVAGEDRIYVYEGQHRYHGALLAIEEGTQLDRLPIVIDEAKSVNRANLIISGVINNYSENLTPLDLASAILELQALDIDAATIRSRLNVTDQTVRDVLLLASAPAAIHKLVREKAVASTLAIEEIRKHGPEKARDRLVAAAAEAKAAGKTKVTKKALPKPTSDKITPVQAKQLLQALQAVRADASFQSLNLDTTTCVLDVLLDFPSIVLSRDIPRSAFETFVDLAADPVQYPIHAANEHGAFADCEKLSMPARKGQAIPPAEIRLAHPEDGAWIYSVCYHFAKSGASSSPHLGSFTSVYTSRFQALCAAHDELLAKLSNSSIKSDKAVPAVRKWVETLVEDARQKLCALTAQVGK